VFLHVPTARGAKPRTDAAAQLRGPRIVRPAWCLPAATRHCSLLRPGV